MDFINDYPGDTRKHTESLLEDMIKLFIPRLVGGRVL
jgi:hypothetical protein